MNCLPLPFCTPLTSYLALGSSPSLRVFQPSLAANYNSQQALLPSRLSPLVAHALADVAPGTRRRGAAGKWRWRLDPAELRAREPEWRPELAVGSGGRDGAGPADVAAAAGDLGEALARGPGQGRHQHWHVALEVRVHAPYCRPFLDVRGGASCHQGRGVRTRMVVARWLQGRQRAALVPSSRNLPGRRGWKEPGGAERYLAGCLRRGHNFVGVRVRRRPPA